MLCFSRYTKNIPNTTREQKQPQNGTTPESSSAPHSSAAARLMLAEGQKKAAEEKLREAEQERVGEPERSSVVLFHKRDRVFFFFFWGGGGVFLFGFHMFFVISWCFLALLQVFFLQLLGGRGLLSWFCFLGDFLVSDLLIIVFFYANLQI